MNGAGVFLRHGTTSLPAGAVAPVEPTRRRQVLNFVLFQSAWFAAVLGAAHGWPLLGTACVLAVIAWHLATSARPAVEARLVACVALLGLGVETVIVLQGHVAYPSGQPIDWLPPYWMVALWAELAMALNVTMRWLKHRLLLAAVLGSLAGPASFASGVRLGGARFLAERPALLTLALVWALAMPILTWLSTRFDGVSSEPPRR